SCCTRTAVWAADFFSSSASFGALTSQARPSRRSAQMPYQFTSNSYQARPWRADCGCAWWLLCQPSPKVSIATQKLLREASVVRKRCLPHMCVAEFTSQVTCRPTTVRRKIPHITKDQPPIASRTNPRTVIGTQCHLLIQV